MEIPNISIKAYSTQSGSLDPKSEAENLIAQIMKLFKADPQKNKAEILKLEKQLSSLMESNPKVFSQTARTDMGNFTRDLEDYYMIPGGDPEIEGQVLGWEQNLEIDLNVPSSMEMPHACKTAGEIAYEIAQLLSEKPKGYMATLKKYEASLQKFMKSSEFKNLPPIEKNKIANLSQNCEKYIQDPSSENEGQLIASADATYYETWVQFSK